MPLESTMPFVPFRANRFDDGRIGGRIRFDAGQRFDNGSALHFVIVDANDGGFAGNVGRGKQEEQSLFVCSSHLIIET